MYCYNSISFYFSDSSLSFLWKRIKMLNISIFNDEVFTVKLYSNYDVEIGNRLEKGFNDSLWVESLVFLVFKEAGDGAVSPIESFEDAE